MRSTIIINSTYLLMFLTSCQDEDTFKCNVNFKGKSYYSNDVNCSGGAGYLIQTVRGQWAIDINYDPNIGSIRFQADISSPVYEGSGVSIVRNQNMLTFDGILYYGANNAGNISGNCSCTKGP